MLVGDLIWNDYFDCHCNYEIYDCTDDGKTWHNAEMIFSTRREGRYVKPLDSILDMKIKYFTVNSGIIIEATRQK